MDLVDAKLQIEKVDYQDIYDKYNDGQNLLGIKY